MVEEKSAFRRDLEASFEVSSSNKPYSGVSSIEVLWVGSKGGMEEELVKREGIPYQAIPAAGIAGVSARSLPDNLLKLGKGFLAAGQIMRAYRPDVLFFTGGYLAVPVMFASYFSGLKKRPASLVYVPDIEPGLALKTIVRFSDQIACSSTNSKKYFPNQTKLMVTGYPTRQSLLNTKIPSMRETFGIKSDLPVLLILGGSRGAHSINQALLAGLPQLINEMEIIHISGWLDWQLVEDSQIKLQPEARAHYHTYPYLHEEMGAALKVAELVLSRAGASTLGEYPLFDLPAILVPYPYAWRYQKVNAQYLVDQGAAVIVTDEELPEKLVSIVRELMGNPQRRLAMKQAMRSLAKPQAAEEIGKMICSLV